LGFIHVMIKEDLINMEFIEKWTNSPFLVRTDKDCMSLLKESDLKENGSDINFVAHDPVSDSFVVWDTENQIYKKTDIVPSMEGEFDITLADGSKAKAKTVWTLYKKNAEEYTSEKVSEITWVPADKIRKAARMYAKSKPSALHLGTAH
ncbi:MAG: dimethylsulfide dehydrogenase, partial [Desulfobacula sp.]|nr:dimethylsulfide dehydrogenase [Desulfobacula sp.]